MYILKQTIIAFFFLSFAITAFAGMTSEQKETLSSYQRDQDKARAPIKSKSDLKFYLKRVDIQKSPLKALDDGARARFLDSLKFNENGITTYSFEELRTLEPNKAYKILSLFGAQTSMSSWSSASNEGSSAKDRHP